MTWIDTHCHFNLTDHFPDPALAVGEAVDSGVSTMIVVGIDEPTSRIAVDLADRFDSIYAVVGYHPTEVTGFTAGWLKPLEELAEHPKVVAIGEIGFDFHWDKSTPEDQERALLSQLELAEGLGLPVVFHVREAYDTMLSLVERRPVGVKQLFHCFVGDLEQARRADALGSYFGVDGPVTFKNAQGLREVVGSLPRDRVVLETDAPFLSPHPFRGKPNSPKLIPLIGAEVGRVWGVSASEVAQQTSLTATKFFGLP